MILRTASIMFCLIGLIGFYAINTNKWKERGGPIISTDTTPTFSEARLQTEESKVRPSTANTEKEILGREFLISAGFFIVGVYFWGHANATSAMKDLARAVRSKPGSF